MTTARVGVDITAQDRTAAAFMSATRSIERFGSVAGAAIKGFATGFASAALVRGIDATVKRMDDLANSAQRMGLATEAMSRLGYAATLNEVPFDTLLQTSKKLNENLADIGAGKGGDAGAAMKSMGLSAIDAAGKIKSVDAVINEVAGKFSQYQDGANKSALATALFGKAGTEMIPMLNQGAAAINAAKAEADAFGLTLSGPAAEAAGVFNNNMDRMTGFVQGVSQTVVSAFLPAVNELIDKFFETADAGSTAQKIIDGINFVILEVTIVIERASAAWAEMLRWTEAVGESMGALADGDFSGAMGAFTKASEDVAKIWADVEARITMSAVQVNRMGKGSLTDAAPKIGAPVFERAGQGSRATPKAAKKPAVDALAEESKRIFEAMQSPLEAHTARMKNLNMLLDKGYISQQTYNRAVMDSQNQYVGAAAALNNFTDMAQETFSVTKEMSTLFQDGLGTALDSIIDRTASVKDAFSNMGTSMLQTASKMFMNKGLSMLFGSLFGAGDGFNSASGSIYGAGGAGGLLSGFFGGNRASGGGVRKGNLYQINENGQELFAPGQDGMMIPNSALRSGGGGGGVTIIDQRTNAPPVKEETDEKGNIRLIVRDFLRSELPSAMRDSRTRSRI